MLPATFVFFVYLLSHGYDLGSVDAVLRVLGGGRSAANGSGEIVRMFWYSCCLGHRVIHELLAVILSMYLSLTRRVFAVLAHGFGAIFLALLLF